jgi:hypothetical protein
MSTLKQVWHPSLFPWQFKLPDGERLVIRCCWTVAGGWTTGEEVQQPENTTVRMHM